PPGRRADAAVLVQSWSRIWTIDGGRRGAIGTLEAAEQTTVHCPPGAGLLGSGCGAWNLLVLRARGVELNFNRDDSCDLNPTHPIRPEPVRNFVPYATKF